MPLLSPPAPRASGDPRACTSPSIHWTADTGLASVDEPLAVEAPLAIEIAYERAGQHVRKLVATTMRTPGHDDELARGFLFAEGLIAHAADLVKLSAADANSRGEKIPTQVAELARPPQIELQRVSRSLVTSSACGLCGRPSLDGLPRSTVPRAMPALRISCERIAVLPDRLRAQQTLFAATGASHGAGLFDLEGELLLAREDVGRHNAVDKLVGAALSGGIALRDRILLLSGRASFELLQKASAAGVPLVVAVGAPSSLAVTLAHQANITLVGFTRPGRFNVYTHADRLSLSLA